MMFKSAVVALAAVQGVIAQAAPQPEFVDVCNPVGDKEAACNKVAVFTAACEALTDLAAQQKCFCDAGRAEVFQQMQNDCRKCKVDNGIAGPKTDEHSEKIQLAAIKAYCPPNAANKKYSEAYAEAARIAGDYPPIGPDNMPSKKTTGPTGTVPYPAGLFEASQHAEISGNGFKVSLDQSISILAGVNKAPAARPTVAPFPTNTTGGAGGEIKFDVELRVLNYDCWCVVSELSANAIVTKECKAPTVVPTPTLKEVSFTSLKVEERAAIFVGAECGTAICAGYQGSITVESNAAVVKAEIIASITVGGNAPAQPQPQQKPQQKPQPPAQKPKDQEDCIPAPSQNGPVGPVGSKTQVNVENRISTDSGAAAPAVPGTQGRSGHGGAQPPSGPQGSQSPAGAVSPAGPGAVAPAPTKSGNANIPEPPKANKSGNANIPQSSTRPAPSTVTGAAAVSMHVSALAVAIAALAATL